MITKEDLPIIKTKLPALYNSDYNRIRKYLSKNGYKYSLNKSKIFGLLPSYFDKIMGESDKQVDIFNYTFSLDETNLFYNKVIFDTDLSRTSFLAQFGLVEEQSILAAKVSDIFLMINIILDVLSNEDKVFMSLINAELNRFVNSKNNINSFLDFYEDLQK